MSQSSGEICVNPYHYERIDSGVDILMEIKIVLFTFHFIFYRDFKVKKYKKNFHEMLTRDTSQHNPKKTIQRVEGWQRVRETTTNRQGTALWSKLKV